VPLSFDTTYLVHQAYPRSTNEALKRWTYCTQHQ